MSENKPKGYAICRQASDPLKPSYITGQQCAICKKELQVSPGGLKFATSAHLLLLCNSCGFEMNEKLAKAGKTFATMYSPDFLKNFRGAEQL